MQRAVTRWGGVAAGHGLAEQLVALVASLRGSVCLYQGEELGLDEADIAFEDLRDPYGVAFWPSFKGRDGCRTPMPWDASETAGFTTGLPWLPIAPSHRALSVATQEADPRSTLHAVRAFLRWRAAQPALVEGDIRFVDADEPVLAFERAHDGRRWLAVFNLSAGDATYALPPGASHEPVVVPGVQAGTRVDGDVRLPPHGVFFATID